MILDPYGMTFDAVSVFGLVFYLDPDQLDNLRQFLTIVWEGAF